MATRHELIHIDFVANAGKANPVLKSLQVSCNDARIAKENLDKQLANAKATNAPAEVIADLEKKLKSQTTTWQQLERGVREYTKGIDTLSKGIKEFNDGTLDQMSAKFNKAVYNSAKLAQSAVKTGSSDWNQLQRLMDATDRNVTRAREDIDLMMQSLKDGSAVSTVQLTRSRDVLEDLARLAVTNSEEWRSLRKQFNEVDAAIASVAETEKRLKGEIATEADAIALSNHLTKESVALRHADGEAAMKTAQAERKGVEETMRGISDRIVLRTKERDEIQEEIEIQEELDNIIKERNEKIKSAQNRKQEAEDRKREAQETINAYEEQEKKVQKLKLEKKDLEEQQRKEAREADKAAKATEEQNKKQGELTQTVATLKGEIGGLETNLKGLEEQIKKTNTEPIKPKVDTSKIEELQAKLKAIQDGIAEKNAQIEAENKKGGAASRWQETLTRLQGDKDGRLSPLGLGEGKKQMDDMLDAANNFYEIIKKVKGVTEDRFIPAQAAEPIKQLAEYYKITEEEARKLVHTLERSEVVNKKYGTLEFNERTGFIAIQKNKGKDDQQVRIEAAQSYMEAARRNEASQTEKVNKLLAEKKKLEEEEVETKGKLEAATKGVADATTKSGEATEKKAKLTKKEQQEVKSLTEENETLTSAIESLKKQLDSLPSSQDKVTDAVKKGAGAAKEEAEAIKMTAEEAKAALDKMTNVGTIKASKNGPIEASNLEGAQQSLFGIFKGAGAAVGNGNFTLTGQDQIRKAVKAFQDKFGIDDAQYAKELMTKLATGKNGGLIRQGVYDVDPITHKPILQISRDEGAWKERLRQQQEYRDIMAGVTTATKEQTAADKAQEAQVKSLREAYQQEKDALEKRNEEYQKRLNQAESMKGPAKKDDGTLTAKGVELEKAEEYRQKYVLKQQEKERKAWEEYQAAKNGNIDVEKSRQKIEEQIAALQGQKAKNTERLTQLQEKGVKATKEQNKADGESVTTGKSMEELLKQKERLTASLTEKQKKLTEAQEELAKMAKTETAAGKEQSDVTEQLTKKTEEYNAATAKLAEMKDAKNKARGAVRSADRSIASADETINTLKNEALPQRKSEVEIGAMKKRVAELTAEVEKETAAFNKNAQAITELNKKETDAAIEMAQSENVSIEKVKQSIELLQKKIQTEATDADTMKLRGEAINRLSERLTQMNAEVAKLSKPIADRLNTKNLGILSETELQQGIDAAKQLLKTYKSGSDEAKALADNIVRAEQYLDGVGIKAAKKAAQQAEEVKQERELHRMMSDRLKDLSSLSADALAETQKYWQAQIDGATRGSQAYTDAEAAMKRITDLENTRQAGQATRVLFHPERYGDAEIREAIKAMEQLRDAQAHGSAQWELYNKRIEEGKKYLDEWAETDKVIKFEGQMQKLPQLSDAALQETKKFWETMVAGAEKGSQELRDYEAHLEKVKQEERERRKLNDEITAQRLNGNLSHQSEQEINEAIEAAKRLIKTYETASPEAAALAKRIADAEEHVKKYGLEAERAARREAQAVADAARKRQEQDDLMRQQLQQGSSLTKEALHTQEQYWQRLISDPKAAASSLADYQQQLDKVRLLQKMMVNQEGSDALDFFRGDTSNASADEIQRQAKALKLWRDSLPQKDNAALIKEIDDYLLKAGQSAMKAAQEAMTFKQAMQVGKTAGTGSFKGTVEQLTQAKKTLEEMSAKAVKGGLAWRRMQEALQRIEIELKNVGHLSQEVQAVLDKPKGRSLNQLKQAVEQGRAALNAMDRTTRKGQKAFDELAKKVKAADLEMKLLAGTAKGTVSAFDKAWSRLKTYVGLYVGAAVAMQKLTATMGDLMELSDKMGEVRKTTGFTADEVGRLTTNLKKMDTRTSIVGLLDLAAAAGQLGLKTQEDVEGFTEAANKLMVALPEMGREGATEMLKVALATGEIDKIRRQMEEGLIDGSSATAVAMEKVGSTIDRLRATSAATAPAITDFVKRVGAVGAQSGITIDQVAALGSTVDALGMRVEMSATALSRMIPAIKNNAFSVAKAIGVTPETLRNLFETGRGMEAILMIFQHIKDAGMDADSIDKMLGMGGMQEVMKELNQQGARAGIVFAGLSQNVDELRRQLGVASEAYEENIAIQQEYDKMNETTAAKWERLKNQLEEFFVGDGSQRFLGGIIDGLRSIINLLTGEGGLSIALRSIILYMTMVKVNLLAIIKGGLTSLGGGLKNIGIMLSFIEGKMTALQWSNIFTALAAAVWLAVEAFSSLKKEADAATRAMSDIAASLGTATREVGNMFAKLNTLGQKQTEATKSAKELKEQEEKLKKELEDLRKKLGDGAETTEEYKKKQEELEKASKDVAEAEGKASDATNRRLGVIKEINDNYSKYLGYMLSEASTAETVASAHDLIVAALKEEMYWREQNNAFKTVTDEHKDNLDSYRKSSLDELESDNVDAMRQQQIMSAWQAELTKVQYDPRTGYTLTPGGTAYSSLDQAVNAMKDRFNSVLITNGGYYMVHTDDKQDRLNNWWGESGFNDKGFEDWTRESLKVLKETSMLQSMTGSAAQQAHENAVGRARENTNALIAQASGEGATNRQMAEAVVGIQKNIEKYGELTRDYQQFASDTSLKGIANVLLKDLPADTRKAVEAEMERVAANGISTGTTTTTTTTSPWGTPLEGESTDWKNMTAEQLVNRRKQMNDFVNAIQTDTDVKAVLKEDAALKKAIEKGMSSDMRTVIEWYNTERLKIQDELHARHLTNTGDWLDPKKQRSAKKQWHDEIDAYLHELDAYYTERKTRIEEAGTDEGLTEAEIRNRTLANEMEWRQRRAELQKIYADKGAEVTQEEMNAIYAIISERTGDSAKFVEQTIAKTNRFADTIAKSGEQGMALIHKWRSNMDVNAERDYLRQQQALTKQMKAIQDIIDRERPFNGITKNLRENLATMDILTGDMRKEYEELMKAGKDMAQFNERQQQEELRRTTFMLGEAENAYSTTIDQVMARMREQGMSAWADWLSVRPEQQEATMAQLRSTYDQIQDAIKKEASQLKKQAEIMWNNILLPGGDGQTTLKQALDRTVAQLGLDESRVSRANSLIGAGTASQRVADRLAIKQMQLQLNMQEHYYNLMKKQGQAHVDMLEAQAKAARERGDTEEATRKTLDAQHARMSLNLATSKEETELAKQREEIIARTEESQNRLYTSLREWAELLSSSVQSLFEASHAGDAEYYNERAKLDLTGKGGPGAGTYVVIDNAGTSDAKAHYEHLDERQALEREHEIERENAQAEAWKKVMDDLNNKMSEQITDWINASLQNQAIDANTDATLANTEALAGLTSVIAGSSGASAAGTMTAGTASGTGGSVVPTEALSPAEVQEWTDALGTEPWLVWEQAGVSAMQHVQQTTADTSKKMTASTQSAFAKMTAAANLYGIAYQAMSNDNLSTSQKFQMMAVQAAGQAAISMLTANLATEEGKTAVQLPGILGKLLGEMPYPAAIATFAIVTGLLGGLMGLAVSKIAKSKSTIAQATGSSVGAGRLATGMLTYAEGNVNEFTDPASLTPGRQYNVDGADGKTYRARYMGKGAKTHITNGPEFHLVGEAGREAIIDAKTTRQIQMDEPGIWSAIQTLYRGGRVSPVRRRSGRGMAAFADGNMDDFEEMGGEGVAAYGTGGVDLAAIQSSLDRNSAVQEALLERLQQPIYARNILYGPEGIVNTYDTLKKQAQRHGEKYL